MAMYTALGASMADAAFPHTDVEGVTIVTLACQSVRERQAAVLGDRLALLADRNAGRLALDMSQVESIAAAGISRLVEAHERCRALGGRLVLFAPRRDVVLLLKATGLTGTMTVHRTRDEATRSFRKRTLPPPASGGSRLFEKLLGRPAT